jgi:hypothetical protein
MLPCIVTGRELHSQLWQPAASSVISVRLDARPRGGWINGHELEDVRQ